MTLAIAGWHCAAGDQGLRSGDTVSATGGSLFTSMMRPVRFWLSGLRIVDRFTSACNHRDILPGLGASIAGVKPGIPAPTFTGPTRLFTGFP